jgi:archaellum component FlaC
MKLLFANHHMRTLAGSELHTADLCRGFRRAGHEVALFTLVPGAISEALSGEGFRIYFPADLRAASAEDFDLVYLHHSTCEALLGPIFAGKAPVVRAHLGYVPELERPLSYGCPSGRVFGSEGVMEVLGSPERVPTIVARNVYDDALVPVGHDEGPPGGPPYLAVVTNHLDTGLETVLREAKEEGLLSYDLFGVEGRSVPVDAELLARFDAVVTIGRTVILAAAVGKPVYVADIHGSDGWLHPGNYGSSQRHNFSGRARGLKDRRTTREELLDRKLWPGTQELTRLRGLVAEDHALSRRVEELERFFGLVMGAHQADGAAATDGRLGVIAFAETLTNKALVQRRRIENQAQRIENQAQRIENQAQQIENRAQRIQNQAQQIENQAQQIENQAQRIQNQAQRLEQHSRQKRHLEGLISQNRERLRLLEDRNRKDRRQLEEMEASRVWKVVRKIDAARETAKAVLLRKEPPR